MMRKILLHAIFWLVFFLMWNRLLYFYIDNEWNKLYFSALDTGLIMVAFYGVYAYLVPSYFRHKHWVKLLLMSCLLVLVLTVIAVWLMNLMLHHMIVPIHFNFTWTYKDMQYNRLLMAVVGVLAGVFVKLALDRFELRRNLTALEKAHAEAELAYLKAQLNPHFLFNSLNSLYSQLELGTGDPKGTLSSIADMLRYQLYDSGQQLVPLEKDLTYLEDYIDLQRLRLDNCIVSYFKQGVTDGLVIAPLLLITFVENAFKHVSDDLVDNFIEITITINNDQLHFKCLNTFQSNDHGNGIGLDNVRKRLSLLYADRQQLNINTEDHIYQVNLDICLKS